MLHTTVLLLTLLPPQGNESQGPLVGFPHAISVSAGTLGGTAPLGVSTLYFKIPGVTTAPPLELAPLPKTPDFRRLAMFPAAPAFDIHAMSLGLDWFLADAMGRAVVPSGGWGMISFSVTKGTVGVAGSVIHSEVLGDGAAADLFTWLIPGSAAPASWVGEVQRGQNGEEVGLSGLSPDLDGHDIFPAGYLLSPAIAAMLPARPSFYFCVAKATLDAVPAAWWGGAANKSAATVLRIKWDDVTRTWSTPEVALKWSDFVGMTQDEAIDALAYDELRGSVTFSTTSAARDPLLVGIPIGGGKLKVLTYTDMGGTPVSKRLGLLQTDDIDALCTTDPGMGHTAQIRQHLQARLGHPEPQRLLPQLPGRTSVAAFRGFDSASNQDSFDCWLIGWPRPKQPAQSIGVVGITFPSAPAIPLFPLQSFVRTPQPGQLPGGPLGFRLQVPSAYVLLGIPVQFHWITAEQQNPGVVDVPHPVTIRS